MVKPVKSGGNSSTAVLGCASGAAGVIGAVGAPVRIAASRVIVRGPAGGAADGAGGDAGTSTAGAAWRWTNSLRSRNWTGGGAGGAAG